MAHINLPGNANHYEQYVKNLVALKDPSELIKSFDPLKFKKDFQFSKVFLSACLALNISKNQILEQLDFIESYHIENSEVRLMTEYLRYGIENVQRSIQFSQLADQNFDSGKINEALDLYIKASKLNPSAYTNFENIGFCYFKLENYREAIQYFLQVVEELNPKTGKSEYLLGNAYFQLGNKKKACTYLYRSTKLNFKASFSDYSRICK
jgi:tetratricopeptide (TPR) repeat protein